MKQRVQTIISLILSEEQTAVKFFEKSFSFFSQNSSKFSKNSVRIFEEFRILGVEILPQCDMLK